MSGNYRDIGIGYASGGSFGAYWVQNFGTSCDEIAGGDCQGSRCGCYNGYCWAYVDEAHTNIGDWWCYTQQAGVYGKQQMWQTCAKDSDCSWDRSCGSCRQHKGFEEISRDAC